MATLGALATAPAVLASILANVLLLTVRAWVGSLGLIHSRRLFYLLDGMIALAFEYVHKRLPGDRNRAAWEAAECCWRYVKSMPAGNIPPEKAISRGEDRLTKWRTYFEAALSQNPILGTNHDEFERHLRIGEELARRSEAENEEDAPPAAKTAAAKREGRARRAQA